jgi:hypothetical protein
MKTRLMLSAALLLALAAPAHAAVTAANLSARCTASRAVCDASVTWLVANTDACIRANVSHADAVTRVIVWLKAHPKQTGSDDHEVTAFAVGALWPCR